MLIIYRVAPFHGVLRARVPWYNRMGREPIVHNILRKWTSTEIQCLLRSTLIPMLYILVEFNQSKCPKGNTHKNVYSTRTFFNSQAQQSRTTCLYFQLFHILRGYRGSTVLPLVRSIIVVLSDPHGAQSIGSAYLFPGSIGLYIYMHSGIILRSDYFYWWLRALRRSVPKQLLYLYNVALKVIIK